MAVATTRGAVTARRRVTINDVAQHLDLTKGTVSRALNGYSDISESTRLKVRRAADQLGYRPLSHAQAIRTGRARSIGLVLQVSEHDGHRPFVADFLAGVSEGASREDWTLTVATAENDGDTLRLLEKISDERKADGFILPRTLIDDPRIAFLRSHDTPFVLYGRTGEASGCAWYDIKGEDAMAEAVMRLARLGHKRIGFMPGAPGYTYAELRLGGYKRGLEDAGLPCDPALICDPAVDRETGNNRAEQLLTIPNPPTAIVCSVDQAALGVYDAARRHNLKIGRDLSLIAYDGIPEGGFVDPPMSTYAVNIRKAGERLADLLIQRARGADPEDLRELDQARFLNRGSHGPAPRRTHLKQ